MKPRALILHATGSNRDHDAAAALELAGAAPEIWHLNQLRQAAGRSWQDFQLLLIPGGFSYADALGAGRLFALDLNTYFAEQVSAFVAAGKPVIGICNGFQALVKAGILPVPPAERQTGMDYPATLTFNASGHFECRWVSLLPVSQRCLWTRGLQEPITCPVAHGEGNFRLRETDWLGALQQNGQVAMVSAGSGGAAVGSSGGAYPDNPNGSLGDIAGVCNPQGNVLGLMPHPENHIFPYQHPRFTRREAGGLGLALFQRGVEAVL